MTEETTGHDVALEEGRVMIDNLVDRLEAGDAEELELERTLERARKAVPDAEAALNSYRERRAAWRRALEALQREFGEQAAASEAWGEAEARDDETRFHPHMSRKGLMYACEMRMTPEGELCQRPYDDRIHYESLRQHPFKPDYNYRGGGHPPCRVCQQLELTDIHAGFNTPEAGA